MGRLRNGRSTSLLALLSTSLSIILVIEIIKNLADSILIISYFCQFLLVTVRQAHADLVASIPRGEISSCRAICSRESPLGFKIYLVKIQIVLRPFTDLERKAIQTLTGTFISKSLIHYHQLKLPSGHGFIRRYPTDTFPKTHSLSNDEDSGIPSFQNLQGTQFDQLNNRRIDCDRAFA